MKIFPKIALLAVGLISAAASLPLSVTAANTGTTGSGPAPAVTSRHPRLRAMLRRRMVAIHRVGRRLNLSSDQVAQLKSFRAQTVDKIKGIRTDSGLTKEQKKAQAREALQTARTEMRGVLTDDQKGRASKMLQRLRRRRRGAV